MKQIILTSLLFGLSATAAFAQQPTAGATKTVKIVRVENGVTTVEERQVPADQPMIILEEEISTPGENQVTIHHPGAEGLSQEEMDAEIEKALRAQGIDPAQAKGKMVVRTVEVVNGDTLINSTEVTNVPEGQVIQWETEGGEVQEILQQHGVEMKEGEKGEMTITVKATDDGSGEKRVVVIARSSKVTICDMESGDCENLKQIKGETPEGKSLRMKELGFYPNPNDGHFTVDFRTRNKKEPVDIRIFDLNGREVYTERFVGETYKKEMDLSNEPAGVYFLELSQAGEQLVKKVVLGQ
jgi:hypothetical protein